VLPDDGALCCVDNGACDAGSREEGAGAAAGRVMCCNVRCACLYARGGLWSNLQHHTLMH
jgi:hypothetical protein